MDRAAYEESIHTFWRLRELQREKQARAGKTDAGSRGAVTGGGHLFPLTGVIRDLFIECGISPSSITSKLSLSLPGYYRPSKEWDLVVVDQDKTRLAAAIELKSQVGPSFGNNFNNRAEEAIGNAVDVWRAYEEGTFGGVRPWLGYVFLLESTPKSTQAVKASTSPFLTEEIFDNASYVDRYRILCKRLVRERLYDAALFVTATAPPNVVISEPDPELGFANFAAAVRGRCAYIDALHDEES